MTRQCVFPRLARPLKRSRRIRLIWRSCSGSSSRGKSMSTSCRAEDVAAPRLLDDSTSNDGCHPNDLDVERVIGATRDLLRCVQDIPHHTSRDHIWLVCPHRHYRFRQLDRRPPWERRMGVGTRINRTMYIGEARRIPGCTMTVDSQGTYQSTGRGLPITGRSCALLRTPWLSWSRAIGTLWFTQNLPFSAPILNLS